MLNMSKEIDTLNNKLVVLVAKAMRTSTKDLELKPGSATEKTLKIFEG